MIEQNICLSIDILLEIFLAILTETLFEYQQKHNGYTWKTNQYKMMSTTFLNLRLACHDFNKISMIAFSQVLEKFRNGSGYIVPRFLSYNIPCTNDSFFRYPEPTELRFCGPSLVNRYKATIEKDLSENNKIIISYDFFECSLIRLCIKTINAITGLGSSVTLNRFCDTLLIIMEMLGQEEEEDYDDQYYDDQYYDGQYYDDQYYDSLDYSAYVDDDYQNPDDNEISITSKDDADEYFYKVLKAISKVFPWIYLPGCIKKLSSTSPWNIRFLDSTYLVRLEDINCDAVVEQCYQPIRDAISYVSNQLL